MQLRRLSPLLFLAVAVAVAVAGALLASATASASPRGTYVWRDLPVAEAGPRGGAPLVIFVNRDGGTYTAGGFGEDSRRNRSSIINGSATIAPFSGSDSRWTQIMDCVRDTYAPFNVEVTDVDPGNVSHVECVTSGRPQDIGMPDGVGGVAPFNCGRIDNAIVYAFAEVSGNDVSDTCWTVAQETAHALGLEHEFYCPDPMTYLYGCGDKRFRDYTAPCGEDSARSCDCGGNTQNSYQMLQAILGARASEPPNCSITSPRDGDSVTPEFSITVEANDDIGLARVELWIDGVMVTSGQVPPYTFRAPATLAAGGHAIVARAVDTQGNITDSAVNVRITPPCSGDGDCSAGQVCIDGSCVAGPGSEGGLGELCTTPSSASTECVSGLCVQAPDGTRCTDYCDPGTGSGCPGAFDCLAAGDRGVCWPSADSCTDTAQGLDCDVTGTCGCVVAARSGTPYLVWLGAAIFGFALVVLRRRRR